MRSIILVGEPGCGKSRVVAGVRAGLGPPIVAEAGLLVYEHYPAARLLVLGRYRDGDPHPGTDRLEVEAEAWLRLLLLHQRHLGLADHTVLWEGPWGTDEATMLVARSLTNHACARLTCDADVLACRRATHAGRAQDADWLADMRLRLSLFCRRWEPDEWPHATEADTARVVARLRDIVGRAADGPARS